MNNNKLTDEPMGLDAAIIHADERAASLSGPCAEQHAQLANWLRELQERRNATSEPIGYTDAEELRSDDNDIWMWKSPHGFGKDIPLYSAPPTPMVHDDLLSMAASAIEDLLEHTDPGTSYYSGVWADVPGKLRAAMLQAGNHTEQHLDMVVHSGDDNENGKDVTLINEGNIPAMQINPVADLYSITSPTGSETTFTFDASEASSFVGSGWSVQKYVELERYQEAITGK